MEKIKFASYTWIDIEKPTEKDIEYLADTYHFHHLALEDSVSAIQRPKLDEYGDYLFLVTHLARHLKDGQRTVAEEIDIFLGKDFIITLHENSLKPIDDLQLAIKNNEPSIKVKSPAYLLYELLDKTFEFSFPMIDKIGQKLDNIEDALYQHQTRQTLEDITLLERDIINFLRIIRPQIRVMKDLENLKVKYIGSGLDIYYDDIVDKIEKINETLDSYKEACEALQRTNEALLTQRLNEVIKILTIFSVLMLPLTIITGFYGMNIKGLPLSDYKHATEFVVGLLVFTVIGMLYYFRKKHWL